MILNFYHFFGDLNNPIIQSLHKKMVNSNNKIYNFVTFCAEEDGIVS